MTIDTLVSIILQGLTLGMLYEERINREGRQGHEEDKNHKGHKGT